jgi:hypothetical protein
MSGGSSKPRGSSKPGGGGGAACPGGEQKGLFKIQHISMKSKISLFLASKMSFSGAPI